GSMHIVRDIRWQCVSPGPYDPRTHEVIVQTPDGIARTYAKDDTLEFHGVLPGFRCSVAELCE
ncbi:MAG: hypothetical protein MI924_23335, partial [Chloroflexales bacterium]|nr:hypothetical protein [Chloroflexales bacterium]